MLKSVARLILFAVSTAGFAASPWAHAQTRQIGRGGSAARTMSSAVVSADCQEPATFGEDYHGLTCFPASAQSRSDAMQMGAGRAAAKDAACRAPATVGEDYQGVFCPGIKVSLPVAYAPSYSLGDDFSGTKVAALPERGRPVARERRTVPARAATTPGNN